MSRTIVLTLDDDVAEYLERLASGQGRTPSDVAAWIVTEDLRREQASEPEQAIEELRCEDQAAEVRHAAPRQEYG